jgi:hypothetical protein
MTLLKDRTVGSKRCTFEASNLVLRTSDFVEGTIDRTTGVVDRTAPRRHHSDTSCCAGLDMAQRCVLHACSKTCRAEQSCLA